MDTRPKSGELIEATVEEVAAWLSATEGRAVSIHEVRRIEAQALRKLRQEFTRRGLFPADPVRDKPRRSGRGRIARTAHQHPPR